MVNYSIYNVVPYYLDIFDSSYVLSYPGHQSPIVPILALFSVIALLVIVLNVVWVRK